MKNRMKHLFMSAIVCALGASYVGCDDDYKKTVQNYLAPTVTDFSPKSGFPANEVTITGTDFGESREKRVGRVYFNGVEATEFVSYSDQQMVVKLPDGAKTGPITVWVWKNSVETSEEFICMPSAKIDRIEPNATYPGQTVIIFGDNFHDLALDKIKVDFNGALGTVVSATTTEIEVVVPEGATTGPISIEFEGLQTIDGPKFTLGSLSVDDIVFDLWDYVTTHGDIVVKPSPENYIESTKHGAYVMYGFTVPADAKYDVSLMASTNQSYAVYLNADLGTEADALAGKIENQSLTQLVAKQGWGTFGQYDYGAFVLKAGVTYYLKLSFLTDGASWVANVNDLRIKLAEDQDAEGIEVGEGGDSRIQDPQE